MIYHCISMKPRNVLFTLFFVLLVLAVFVVRSYREPRGREPFDRSPDNLSYTGQVLARMTCDGISKDDVEEVMENGVINLGKGNRRARPCPSFALQGTTEDGEYIRVLFSQCAGETKVLECYSLRKKTAYPCN
jgi:hypothetical protein